MSDHFHITMKKAFVSGLALIAGLSLASAEGKILKAVSTEFSFYRDTCGHGKTLNVVVALIMVLFSS